MKLIKNLGYISISCIIKQKEEEKFNVSVYHFKNPTTDRESNDYRICQLFNVIVCVYECTN